jgi:threonine 3-dehydrogenase
MKALVKKNAEEGLWLEDVPMPAVGGSDVLIKVHKTGHLWHRCAHLQLG